MGSHRVGHDLSDSAAAAAIFLMGGCLKNCDCGVPIRRGELRRLKAHVLSIRALS